MTETKSVVMLPKMQTPLNLSDKKKISTAAELDFQLKKKKIAYYDVQVLNFK